MGVELAPDEVAYRCNLVTRRRRPARWSTSPPATSRASRATRSSPRSTPTLGGGRDGVRFHPASSTATCASCRSDWADAELRPAARPHRHAGGAADRARPRRSSHALMDASKPVVARGRGRGRVASRPRSGCGVRACSPQLPAFAERYGVAGRLSLGGRPRARPRRAHRASRCVDVPGATAGLRQRLRRAARRRASRRSPTATSSSSTSRPPTRPATRARRREGRRRSSGGTPTSSARSSTRSAGEPFRILLLPDHATPCALRTHTSEPVPYLFFDSERAGRRAARTPSAASPDRAGPVPRAPARWRAVRR